MRCNSFYVKKKWMKESRSSKIVSQISTFPVHVDDHPNDLDTGEKCLQPESVSHTHPEIADNVLPCDTQSVHGPTKELPENEEGTGRKNAIVNSAISLVHGMIKAILVSDFKSAKSQSTSVAIAGKKSSKIHQEEIKNLKREPPHDSSIQGKSNTSSKELEELQPKNKRRRLVFDDEPLQPARKTSPDIDQVGKLAVNIKQKFSLHPHPARHSYDGSPFLGFPSSVNYIKDKRKCLRRSKRGNGNSRDAIASVSQMEMFVQLTDSPVVHKFLEADVCRRYADNYLLAMVFTYFVRCRFTQEDYTMENFFAALYLAHDMEEDEEDLKYEVFPWALGPTWRRKYYKLLQIRDDIFWKIDCHGVVSRRCCDQVMEIAPNYLIWKRSRPDYHAGARREYLRHPDDNGFPRGPLKSPLQCFKCLEDSCLESSHSYLLYLSGAEFTSDEEIKSTNDTKDYKDSGFDTLVGDPVDSSSGSLPMDCTLESNGNDFPSKLHLKNDGYDQDIEMKST